MTYLLAGIYINTHTHRNESLATSSSPANLHNKLFDPLYSCRHSLVNGLSNDLGMFAVYVYIYDDEKTV